MFIEACRISDFMVTGPSPQEHCNEIGAGASIAVYKVNNYWYS